MHFAQPSSHPPPSSPPPYSPNIDSGTEADIDIDISRCEHRANIHKQQRKQGEMKMDENEVLTPILFETQQEEQRGMRKKGRRRKMMEKSKRRSKSKIGSECKCCEEKRQRRRRERMENKSASHEMCRKSKLKKYSELEKGVCTAAGTAYSEASGSAQSHHTGTEFLYSQQSGENYHHNHLPQRRWWASSGHSTRRMCRWSWCFSRHHGGSAAAQEARYYQIYTVSARKGRYEQIYFDSGDYGEVGY
ncbi:hypothetical protein BDZ91DRAFT_467732 [Kalaharituber pfeilii]|nr:hypothetical protein BDZ91DRAFT_467732 [Kalaharituber pfeilii]